MSPGIVRANSDFPFGDPEHGLVCTHCGADVDADFCELTGDDADAPLLSPCCATVTRPSRPDQRGRKAMAARWGEDVAACGFVVTPNVLLEHLAALGLEALDCLLLELLESRRRGDSVSASTPAFPSVGWLASRADTSDATVKRRLGAMVEAGLLERQERRRPGTQRHLPSAYRRVGLTAVLDLIAGNRRAGRDDLENVPRLRAELRAHAETHSSRVSRGDHECHSSRVSRGSDPQVTGDLSPEPQTTADPQLTGDPDPRLIREPTHSSRVTREVEDVKQRTNETDSLSRAPTASQIDGPHPVSDEEEPFDWFGDQDETAVDGTALEVVESTAVEADPEPEPDLASAQRIYREWIAWRDRRRRHRPPESFPEPEPERPGFPGEVPL